jgi:hypothetical protein
MKQHFDALEVKPTAVTSPPIYHFRGASREGRA